MEDQPINLRVNVGQRRNLETLLRPEPKPPVEPRIFSPKSDDKFVVKVFDKIIAVSIFMIFFGLPIFFTNLAFQGISFEKQIYFYFWLFLGLVAWTAKGVIIGEMNIKRTALDIPIVLFWIIYLVATILSVDRWHSFWGTFGDPSRGFVSITAFVIAYYLIRSIVDFKKMRWMFGAFISSGFITALWTTLALLGIHFLPAKWEPFAPISLVGSMPGLGILFSMLVPLIVTAAFKIKSEGEISGLLRKSILVFLVVDLAIILFILLALYPFVPWIGILVGAGVFLIYILSQLIRPPKSLTWLPMAVFVIILACLMIGNNKLARINLPLDVMPNNSLSMEIAKNTLKSKFFFGTGPATYGYSFSLYKPKDFNLNQLYNLRFYQGKGLVFEALSTTGAAGTLAFALVVLSFISVVGYLLTREKERNKVYSLGLSMAALIFIIDMTSSRVESAVLILGVMISILALGCVLEESGSEEKSWRLSLKTSPKYALTLAFIFMVISAGVTFLFVYLGKLYVADVYAGMALRENTISEQGSITKLIRAVQLYNREGRYFSRVGQEYLYLANTEALKSNEERDVNKISAYLNSAILASVRAKELSPNDVFVVENLAQIYENSVLYVPNSVALAEENYKRALALEPENPLYLIKLGQIRLAYLINQKDDAEKKQTIQEAQDLFQQSIDRKINLDLGYYNLSIAQEALENIDGAIDNMGKAASLDRSSVDYLFNLGRLYQTRGKDDDNKMAEAIYKEILKTADNSFNVHFNLGRLYETMKQKDAAVAEYQKVLEIIPTDSSNKQVRDQLTKMISNIKAGIQNTPENLGLNTPETAPAPSAPVSPQSVPPTPGETVPQPAPQAGPQPVTNPAP